MIRLLLVLILAAPTFAAGTYLEVAYPPNDKTTGLELGVKFTLWLPDGVKTVRGIIVHQHGCGSGACKGGETAAYDLHWQALAKKWDCALLGPSYQQDDKQNCRLWCDPRNGSAKAFLLALHDFARDSKRPEIETAPWCLWGHSGGGFWASLMLTMYPERIVAIWFRSGTAISAWEKGEIPKPEIPAAAYGVPLMFNPGAKENGDKRFSGAWTGSLAMLRAFRAKGSPAGFAPDPKTGHECGDSRYLAIPYFDACLAMRLSDKGNILKSVDVKSGWLSAIPSDTAVPFAEFKGKIEDASWLPNERIAKAWTDYVKTGAVTDTTPPPAAYNVKTVRADDGSATITWDAEADFESGIRAFSVQRNGREIAQVPEKPIGKFGRALFQSMSYHDTPEAPLPEMKYVDKNVKPGEKVEYRIVPINGVGLKTEAKSGR